MIVAWMMKGTRARRSTVNALGTFSQAGICLTIFVAPAVLPPVSLFKSWLNNRKNLFPCPEGNFGHGCTRMYTYSSVRSIHGQFLALLSYKSAWPLWRTLQRAGVSFSSLFRTVGSSPRRHAEACATFPGAFL